MSEVTAITSIPLLCQSFTCRSLFTALWLALSTELEGFPQSSAR